MNSKEKAMLYRGMDQVRQRKFEQALETFDRIIAANPNIPEAWNNRGVALYSLGRLDEALESYDRSLALEGNNLDALRNKAFLLRSQRRLDEALEVYDIVLQKGGDGYDQESAAVVLTGLGRLEEALSCLYLAREQLSFERLEEEIAAVKALMEERGLPVPERVPEKAQGKE
jgi:tetratricopeptide (TPR) repeat protein